MTCWRERVSITPVEATGAIFSTMSATCSSVRPIIRRRRRITSSGGSRTRIRLKHHREQKAQRKKADRKKQPLARLTWREKLGKRPVHSRRIGSDRKSVV